MFARDYGKIESMEVSLEASFFSQEAMDDVPKSIEEFVPFCRALAPVGFAVSVI